MGADKVVIQHVKRNCSSNRPAPDGKLCTGVTAEMIIDPPLDQSDPKAWDELFAILESHRETLPPELYARLLAGLTTGRRYALEGFPPVVGRKGSIAARLRRDNPVS